jgi:hypothetical protein
MTEAPERIWIDNERHEQHWHIGKPPTSDRYAHVFGEYIRSDLARPMTVAEAAKLLLDASYADPVGYSEFLAEQPFGGIDGLQRSLRALSQGGE